MPTYVALMNWAEEGFTNFMETVDRYEAAKEAGASLGVTFRESYWTMGVIDCVGIIEAPDDEALTEALLAMNLHDLTALRVFDPEEISRVVNAAL